MQRRLLLSLAALLVTAGLFAAEPAAAPAPAGKRVLFTAHSFHAFVPGRLQPLVESAGIQGHQKIGPQVIGGSRVKQHWDLPDEKNLAKKTLQEGKADVITMSPIMTLPDEGIELFMELGLKHNPNLVGLVQASWIPFDDWEPGKRVKANDERDGLSLDVTRAANARFKAMLEKQVQELNEKLGRQAVFIVPVGDAVLKLRELVAEGKAPGIAKQSELFTDPIGHAKTPVQQLAAYCYFACIYHRSPVGVSDAGFDRTYPELKPILQTIAWETVQGYPFSGVKPAGK